MKTTQMPEKAEAFAALQDSSVSKYRLEANPLDASETLHVIILQDGRKFKLTDKELKNIVSEAETQDSKPLRGKK